MSRHIRVLLTLAVLVPVLAWSSPSKAESGTLTELMTNGGFETYATGWGAQHFTGANNIYAYNPFRSSVYPVHTGQFSASVAGGNEYFGGGLYFERLNHSVSLPTGTSKVTVSYWVYFDRVGSTKAPCGTITPTAGMLNQWLSYSCDIPIQPAWVEYEVVFESQQQRDYYTVFIDDVSVIATIPISAPAPVVTAPVISLNSPVNGSTVQTGTVTIAGTIKSPTSELTNYYYWYNEKPYYFTLDAQGNFSVLVTLTSSDNWFVFVANNRYGLESRQAYQVKYKPTPRVLGVSTSSSALTSVILKNGKFQLKTSATTKTIQPFPGYTGKIYAKRIEVAPDEIYFIFVALDAGKAGKMVIYNQAGNVTDRNAPFGTFKPGYNVSMIVSKMTNQIFLAVSPKKWGNSASLFEIQAGKFVYLGKAVVGKKTSGDLRVKLMSPDGQSIVLATGIMGKKATLKSWRYSEFMNCFNRTVGSDRHVRMKKSALSWK